MKAVLTTTEREFVIDHLSASRDRMLRALDGLTDAQLRFNPDAEIWSVGECCEHVRLVESSVLHGLRHAPELTDLPDVSGNDKILMERVPVADRKVVAPESARPMGNWADLSELIEKFALTRQDTLDYAAASPDHLHAKIMPHPFIGPLDGYQWLIFLGSHCERHVRQMEAVKNLADFPTA